MVSLLQGQPRHVGLGVEESVYLDGGTDEINAAIYDASRDLALSDVMTGLRVTHEELRTLVGSMSDEDMQESYSHFLPDDPGGDDGQPIIARLFRATVRHFDAHCGTIEKTAAGS